MAIEVIALPQGKSIFESDEEYRRFVEEFVRDVMPILEDQRWARAMSERDALYRPVKS